MTKRILSWVLPRIPAMCLGAGIMVWLSTQAFVSEDAPPGRVVWFALGTALMGAVVGLWVRRCLGGLRTAFRAGSAQKVLLRAMVGGIVLGLAGLIVRSIEGQSADLHPWLLGASYLGAWARWTIGGATLTLLGQGENYPVSMPPIA